MMKNKINIVISSMKLVIAFLFSKCFGTKDVWLISERNDQARDNGYCFYKFMKQKHSEQKVFYLIDKNAKDINKLKDPMDTVIAFDSWKHYMYYCMSKTHISAHVNGCCPSYAVPASRRLKNKIGFKDVFIPHGVSYGISEFCLKKYTDINLFICSGKTEYENVLSNYGYTEEEVAYTGFPRLDSWHHFKTNPGQIVLMPTWRLYLAQNPDVCFEDTFYYHEYSNLIGDKELELFLVENGLKLVFYLHNEMRKYAMSFQTDCPNIEIVYDDNLYDIQDLLKSSALLITDYSSVHFDFAYMNKPVIYYQFDKEEFFKRQYKQSTFDAETDGFGPVVYDKAGLISELKEVHRHNFDMGEKYRKRMRLFYVLYDENNCERVFQAIKEISEQ